MKKIVLSTFMMFLSIVLLACQKVDYESLAGTYTLKEATSSGMDITSEFYAYKVVLNKDQTMTVFINYLNVIQNRQSTYTYKQGKIIEKHQQNEYSYTISEDRKELVTEKTSFDETMRIVLIREDDQDTPDLGVDFETILFGDNIDLTKRFNYAPSIIIEEDNGKTYMHIWYCMNRLSGVIVDHIGYRKAALNEQNRWVFSEEEIALAPTPGTWDSRHVCDPSVIKGEFTYQFEVYNYMMSYLGCETEDYSNNETGLAVAKNPEGPWIKLDHLNPIVPWNRDNQSGMWGTGMPSLLSIDKKGEVLLFYSNSIVGVSVDHYDFSNLDQPTLYNTKNISAQGLKNPNGTSLNYVGLADFAYDPTLKRLYMTTYTPTKNPPDVTLTRVNSHGAIHYIEDIDSIVDVVDIIMNQTYSWTLLDFVGPEDTGFPRNHNLGIVRNPYGYVYDSNSFMIVISSGQVDYPNENIFTYRLKGYILKP